MELVDAEIDYGHASIEIVGAGKPLTLVLQDLKLVQDIEVRLIQFLSKHPQLIYSEKYDKHVPVRELAIQYVEDVLDVEGAREWLFKQNI